MEEIFDGVFLFQGTSRFGPGVRVNKIMTVVRQGSELVVINSAKLGDDDERALRSLGTVKHLVRIGAGHGLDDKWFVDRFAPTTWALKGMSRREGVERDHIVTDGGPLPLDAKAFVFDAGYSNEGALLLPQNGGVLVACDALQAWRDLAGCSWLGGLGVKRLGFLAHPLVIGPIWLDKQTNKQRALMKPAYERLLSLAFTHFVGGHGHVLRDRAKAEVRAAMARMFPG